MRPDQLQDLNFAVEYFLFHTLSPFSDYLYSPDYHNSLVCQKNISLGDISHISKGDISFPLIQVSLLDLSATMRQVSQRYEYASFTEHFQFPPQSGQVLGCFP